MDDLDSTYAPQSPDLSGTYEEEPKQPHPQHQQYRGSVSHISPFTPTDSKSTFHFPQSATVAQPQHNLYFSNNNPFQPQHQYQLQHQHQIMKHEDDYDDEDDYQPTKVKPSSRAKKMKIEPSDLGNGNDAPGFADGIEVRTKFPVARIKRIMQADEDVGKVAQVTPVAVSKALELFMISLVTKAAKEAKDRGSKRVIAAHLKQAVVKDDQFDFLSEIVSKVQDAPAPRTKDEDSDEPMDGGAPPKKKRAATRRKRKGDDDF